MYVHCYMGYLHGWTAIRPRRSHVSNLQEITQTDGQTARANKNSLSEFQGMLLSMLAVIYITSVCASTQNKV